MSKVNREKFKVLEGVFDEFTLETLETLKRKKYFDELGKPIKTGKEGDVYFAYKGNQVLAIKIYRITTANFKKISQYISRDFRFKNIKGNLRKVILAWAQKEFRNLSICHKENISVPYPYKTYNNVVIMDYIDGPMLKDAHLDNPQEFFELLKEQLKILRYSAKLIHGDLSEFNLLVKDNHPVLIDMGQSLSIRNEEDFKDNYDWYERDVKNVVFYFNKKYELGLDLDEVMKELDIN